MPKVTTPRRREEWYVMRHMEPAFIDRQLREVNSRRAEAGKPELLYVIPHQYILKVRHDDHQGKEYNDSVDENNRIRNDFHYFVFIRATLRDLRKLLLEPWNTERRLRLYFCRGRDGHPLRAKADEMDRLISLFLEQRQKFHFVRTDHNFELDEKVRLRTGVFKDYEFSVTRIRHTGSGVNITLGLPLFNGEFTLQMEDYPVSDLEMPMHLQHFLDPAYLNDVARELIAILRHRVRRQYEASNASADADKLNTFHLLNYLEYADTADYRRLRVLLLLCAALRKDLHTVEALVPEVEGLLGLKDADKGHPVEPADDEEALIMAVLFVATHNITYRTILKQYGQTHPSLSEPLSSLLPLVKELKVRRPKQKANRKYDKILSEQSRQTLKRIKDCDFAALSPVAAQAISDILMLNRSVWGDADTLLSRLHASHPSLSAAPASSSTSPLSSPSAISLPSAASLSAASLPSAYLSSPFASQSPASSELSPDLFDHILTLYRRLTPGTDPWWQLKALLEHHSHDNP